MIYTKLISSMEKPFFDQSVDDFETLESGSFLLNERYYFQLIIKADEASPFNTRLKLTVSGIPEECVYARDLRNVPVMMPAFDNTDENYLRTSPGLYPDYLTDLHYNNSVFAIRNQLKSVFFEINPNRKLESRRHRIKITLTADDGTKYENILKLNIINALLPKQSIKVTQWFHCDSLAQYYSCEVWSERHWEIIENFAAVAVKNGINLLLTPIFTPPLDTAVGGERLTTQLVDVNIKNGKYSFGFKKLDRWIDMCNRVGIEYFEISHLFTQWGATHAPKIMATVDGEYKKIFGWETSSTGEEYSAFLRTFLKKFLSHMKARGDDKRCLFHISDEPNETQIEDYKKAKSVVADLLKGYTIMDALSNFAFYEQKVVETPVPSSDHIQPFIDAAVPNLWTYYCCGEAIDVSNRFISMPLWRTRSIGMQFYKYDIVGFLQWGFNFYNNCHSVNSVNPYNETAGDYWVPAGDCFSVYPDENGKALESIRIISFYEALQDMRAMQLAESLYGKKKVINEIEKLFGNITFGKCAKSAKEIYAVREKINTMIAKAVK